MGSAEIAVTIMPPIGCRLRPSAWTSAPAFVPRWRSGALARNCRGGALLARARIRRDLEIPGGALGQAGYDITDRRRIRDLDRLRQRGRLGAVINGVARLVSRL